MHPGAYKPSSQTCLDLLFTNIDPSPTCDAVETHISDQKMVVGSFKVGSVPTQRSNLTFSRDFREFSLSNFTQQLQQNGINTFSSTDDVDDMWAEWHLKFVSTLDNCVPLKSRRVGKKNCPWMSAELLDLMHERQWLYKRLKACRFGDTSLFSRYRKVRNAANNMYRRLKNDHFSNCCYKYKDNPSRLWDTILV